MKVVALLFLSLITVRAQISDGQSVVSSGANQYTALQVLAYNNVAKLPAYICTAASKSVLSTVTVSAASNANPVSLTATSHNLGDFTNLGATVNPIIKVTGYTGNWAPLNGVWAATITSASAFTLPVDSTTFGAVTGTPAFTTYNPRLNNPVWSIEHFLYDTNNLFITSVWAGNPPGAGTKDLISSSTGGSFACSSRATLAYQ